MPVRRAVCLCVVGLDGANAREGNSHSFIETTRLMSSVSFPLWPGLSEPSQAHRPLGSLTGNGFELLRGSDTLPGGRGGAVGHWLVTPGVVRGWLPGKKGGEGGSSPWTGDPWVAHGGQGSSRQSECPMRQTWEQDSQFLFTPFCFHGKFTGWPATVLQHGGG